MSGPKTSDYTLTRELRRALAEQRQRQVQLELLERMNGDIRSIVVEADRCLVQWEPLDRETGGNTGMLEQIRSFREGVMELIRDAQRMGRDTELTALQEMNRNLRAAAGKLETVLEKGRKEFSARGKVFRREMTERISQGFGFSFDDLGVGKQEQHFRKKILDVLDELSTLRLTHVQRTALDQIRTQADGITDEGYLKNFHAMTVIPFAKECRAYQEAYAAFGEAYEQKRLVYEMNARELGIRAEEIPFSEDAVAKLDAKIRETEAAILFREEQAYISRCVDEAMQEMGYTVLGNREIVKRSGKRFRNELYLFDEGTAVNVTYSDSGQITMELGGISTDDRIPSRAESMGLVSDMRQFCDDYEQIELRLRQKGIIAKRIAALPPDAQYAQMINVSDYHLQADVCTYETETAKKRAAGLQTRKIGE